MSIAHDAADTPSVSVLAPDDAAQAPLLRLVGAMGLRALAASEDALPLGDVVLIDIRDLSGPEAARWLARADGARDLVVRTGSATIDIAVAARPDADIVVGGDEIELRLALAAAAARSRGGSAVVNDVTSDEGLRLQHLADELARIARTLIDLPQGLTADSVADGTVSYRSEPADDADAAITAAEVRRLIRLRRMRERFFSAELFADPAWDMLLDLSAARIERSRVAVSSLCIAAAVPPTTALRWIKAMTDRGLLRRTADAHDARRIFIQLSDDAAAAMDKYLRMARASGGLAI